MDCTNEDNRKYCGNYDGNAGGGSITYWPAANKKCMSNGMKLPTKEQLLDIYLARKSDNDLQSVLPSNFCFSSEDHGIQVTAVNLETGEERIHHWKSWDACVLCIK